MINFEIPFEMIYGSTSYSLYNGKLYRLYAENNIVNLYSLNEAKYDSILGLDKKDIKNAYRTKVWVQIRGCEALYKDVSSLGMIMLDVRPSEDVDILEAKEVERGVFHASLPVIEVERIWEVRMPFLDFPFPENLEKQFEYKLEDLISRNDES